MPRTPAERTRTAILAWLGEPAAHAVRSRWCTARGEHGATARAVAAGLGIPVRAAKTHLALLVDLGLLRTRRVCHRTYYRRDEFRIAEVARLFEKGW
ncbi:MULTISPECIES: helix-turn-helix domain-containing protein [unclassified Streptomyces]|uniref:helix-turn-helix domain-containing protein n=1 Tax=unclassified Streptomyces TaxID=2593676 RepID=UPI0003782D9E|nr:MULTISPECIES: helix-turn-helix domain-containing protein [unclassified Streptomyces]MYX29455.1 helix-turn-helix domain-containing protein [Streptomyces sp. SID8381]